MPKQFTEPLGSEILDNEKSPTQWVEALSSWGLAITERTLREKANLHDALLLAQVRRLARSKEVRHVKVGGINLLPMGAVEEYLDANTVEPEIKSLPRNRVL